MRSFPAIGGRHLVATGLLTLTLLLGVLVAWQSVRSARERRAAIQSTLQDHADFAAMIAAGRAYRELGDLGTRLFSSWVPGHQPVVPDALVCAGGNPYFDLDSEGSVQVGGTALNPGQRRFIADSLGRGGQGFRLLKEAHWRQRFVYDPVGGDSYFILRRRGLVGVKICIAGQDRVTRPLLIQRMMQEGSILPDGTGGDLPADSLVALTVTAGGDTPLYSPAAAVHSPYKGSSLIGSDLFGDLTVRSEIRPELARRLAAQRLPAERTALVLGLLLLCGMLVVAALVQVGRERLLANERSAFVASVSHELRTPLSQILLFSELLSLDRLRSDDERRRALHIIDQETRRLMRLVENVLQFSYTGAANRLQAVESLYLEAVVQDTVEAFRPLARARGDRIAIDVPGDVSVCADRGALRQILLNLFDNAVKYGPDGQTVRVTARAENGMTRIHVEDQGPGIPSRERTRIFQGHYRLPRDARSAVTGTGLGLSVVQSLAREMDGRVWVEDGDTGGARFVVELRTTGG